MTTDARVPVIIGVGQVCNRPDDPFAGMESRALMHAALLAAEADSGVAALAQLEWLGVEDQISFPDPDIAERLARELPPRRAARPPCVSLTADASGDGPVRLMHDAANLIAQGAASVAAVVGGEALRTAGQRARIEARQGRPGAQKTNLLAELAARMATPLARRYRLLTPIDVYPLYENATRAAWGQSLDEAQAESAAIWSTFSHVAAANPHAWLRTPMAPHEILADVPANPMLSFPYRKRMVANSSVNMGAAVILASLAWARERQIPEHRLVYVGRGAAAHEPADFLTRDSYAHSASLTASIRKTLEFNGVEPDEIDHAELYSCFPCVPKMARRVLQWPLEKPHSVYGGLTFGGGPVGNCMTHAAAAMVGKLRGTPSAKGLIVANGGYATHNHAILLGRRRDMAMDEPQDYRVDEAAARLRGPAPELLDDYEGPGTIETFVAPFDPAGAPLPATVIARTPAGQRFLATVPADDRVAMDRLTAPHAAPVGTPGHSTPLPDGRSRWSF